MSSTFVLAPVPAAARRNRVRANSRSSIAPNVVGRSRSSSNASYSSARNRSRSRRPSFRNAPAAPRRPSASFVNFADSPYDTKHTAADLLKSPMSPATGQLESYLHTFGYQASFLQSANHSPRPIFRRIFSKSQPATPNAPVHKELPPVPPVPSLPARTPTTKAQKNQKANKTQKSTTNVRPAPSYAMDVQLAIFFDGGKEKDYLARAATKAPKGLSTDKSKPTAVREVGGFKDEKGMLWWDETERDEFAALLSQDTHLTTTNLLDDDEWVDFDYALKQPSSPSSSVTDTSVEALLDQLEELVATGGNGQLLPLPSRSVLAMPRARGAAPAYVFPVPVHSNSTTTTSARSFSAARATRATRRRRAGPPPPLTLVPPSPFGARTGDRVVGVTGPIASARHFKQTHAHSQSLDDALVARQRRRHEEEAEFAWTTLVGPRAAPVPASPKSAGLPKRTRGGMGGLFKGLGKAKKPGMF